jgi:ATP-dependent Lon protease
MSDKDSSKTLTESGEDLPLAEKPALLALPEKLPVLGLSDVVLFPGMVVPLLVNTPSSTKLIDDVVGGDRLLAAVLQKDSSLENAGPNDLHEYGCAAKVLRMLKLPDETVRILVQGLKRIRIVRIESEQPYLVARVAPMEDQVESSIGLSALARNASNIFQQIISLSSALPEELKVVVSNLEDPAKLSDLIASNLNIPNSEKQHLLEMPIVRQRLSRLTTLLNKELQVLKLGSEIQTKVSDALGKSQREFILREQLKQIHKELGEEDAQGTEVRELREKIEKTLMPAEVKKVALREVERLGNIPVAAAEYTVSRTYLDWLVSLPWEKSTEDKLDIARARRVLDEDHYNLEKVKERILEYLSVLKLKQLTPQDEKNSAAASPSKAPILCFVGPPGVGKTSLGMSIARALDRKFVRISLGGVHDEAEIRGHRRTYVGALPGRVIQGIRKAESNNPVFILDEIDKIGQDFRGDPSAALLEVLDPQQNSTFSDHYIELPFDLSRVMFITTANILDPIPPALLDRMEVIELAGYTEMEKIKIAQNFLIPRQLKEHGLSKDQITLRKDALRRIVREYTREAGVRNLEREIGTVHRKVARRIVEKFESAKTAPAKITVTAKDIPQYLGAPKYFHDIAERTRESGIATALAWTPTGGDILFVEATSMPGKGSFTLTGSLGGVMKESAQAALTFIRSHCNELDVDCKLFEKNDIHIHVPAGAIPKDGPSAGVTMAVALASLWTGRPVRHNLAMTGEITLRGKVLPVGGIKEKILAAERSGIKEVLIPERNLKDLEDVPAEIRNRLKIIPIKTIEQAIKAALKR